MSHNIIVNSPSIIYEKVNQIIEVYQNDHSTGEDPKAKILDRHLIGLTTHKSYNLRFKHDSDKLNKIEYQVNDLLTFAAGVSHWANWQNSSGIFLSIDTKLFDFYSNKFIFYSLLPDKYNIKTDDSMVK